MPTAAQFRQVAQVPAARQESRPPPLGDVTNVRPRRGYKNHVSEFAESVVIRHLEEFRGVTRARVIAWRRATDFYRSRA